MNLTLVSHASVVINAGAVKLWTDPWLVSKAFNHSWALLGTPAYCPAMLDTIDYLWLSHEHPDHFNLPTLASLPQAFKQRVTVLFQQKNSDKIFDALRGLGYAHLQALPDRRMVRLGSGVDVYCCQVGLGDSCLGVRHGGDAVFNVNDAELSPRDCRRIARQFGHIDLLLNQFSLAGYNGYRHAERVLPLAAQEKLARLAHNHRDLGAVVTIPFASFMYFCADDNRFLNRFGNTPRTVASFMREQGCRTRFLFLGETVSVRSQAREAPDAAGSEQAIARWMQLYDQVDTLDYSVDAPVDVDTIAQLAMAFSQSLRRYFPSLLLRRVKPVLFHMRDLGVTAQFNLATGQFQPWPAAPDQADILVHASPLAAAFKFPFGFETLAVSGRFVVQNNFKNWQLLKSITILWNNQLYLRPRYLLNPRLLHYLCARIRTGLLRQMAAKARLRAAALQVNNAGTET